MHPAFYSWWKHAREGREGFGPEHAGRGCGPGGGRGERHGGPGAHFGGFGGFDDGAGPFGVRRPLRFLAHKLELDEAQTEELARIIDALKTERAQAEVDQRRTVTAFADAMEEGTFGEPRAREGGDLRVKSAERVREAVLTALGRIHALLEPDQRKRFAYLIRTGVLTL